MRRILLSLTVLTLFVGCGRNNGFKHKSDRFHFKIAFPANWEVWDRSSDSQDYLVGSLPDQVPNAEIAVKAVPVAPDISPNEIYPSFLDGSDYADRNEFNVEDKGSISCSNSEGRFIKYRYLGDKAKMRGIKVMFIGNRMLLEIYMEMPEDAFITHELDFNRMIKTMEL